MESSANKILQLETENKRLHKQLALLRDGNDSSLTSKTTRPNKTSKSRHIANGISGAADRNAVDLDQDAGKLQARLASSFRNAGADGYSALETRASLLERENRKLGRKADGFQQTAESLERENGRLIGELERAATEAKECSAAAGELESEKKKLERCVERLESGVESSRRRASELERDVTALRAENVRLQQRHLAELGETTDHEARRSVETPPDVGQRPIDRVRSDANRCVTDIIGSRPSDHYF